MRIEEHPIIDFKKRRGKKIRIYFESRELEAYEGEPIAEALHANGIRVLNYTVKGRTRGLFCAIGKCSSCLMRVNGIPNIRTCITLAEDGMKIERQRGLENLPKDYHPPKWSEAEKVEGDIIVIGGGPAGLMASIKAAENGAKVILLDENPNLGGQLIKQTHKFFGKREQFAGIRGIDIAEKLRKEAMEKGVKIYLETSAIGIFQKEDKKMVSGVKKNKKLIEFYGKAIIVATGAMEKMIPFENNDLPGVYGAGAIQTLMNTYGIEPGKKVLIIGAGNVGVILAYQLIQAGVEVVGIVEALPRIGAYFVHAAKIRRLGVPILTRHTIIRAEGKEKVEGAVIAEIDEKWRPIEGTERKIDVDIIALGVGLRPSIELLHQAGCQITYAGELGGHVVRHDERMETTVRGIFVAGDSSGIEEATTAMLEGKIAGLSAALLVGKAEKEVYNEIMKIQEDLKEFRSGPFGARILKGLEKVVIK